MIRTIAAALILVAAGTTATAQSRSQAYTKKFALLDGRAASQYNNSVRLQPEVDIPPARGGATPPFRGAYAGPFLDPARAAARRYGIPENLFLRLVQRESAWNPRAVSHKGAIGLAQLMPGTATLLRVDPHDPVQNLDGGARYLAQQYRTFGNWRHALAAYNAGPGAVRRHGGVPPYDETRTYVAVILGD